MKFTWQIKSEWLLGVLVVFFLAIIFLVYFWGISGIISSFNQAFSASPVATSTNQFQSDTAQKILKARGILQ